MSTPSPAPPPPSRGRLFLALGLLLPVLGVIGYVAQLKAQWLFSPWYLPVLATLGVGCVVVALVRRRTVWRMLSLLPVLLVAAGGWLMLLGLPLPAYTGPVAVGRPFPAFATTRADGMPFTRRDLEGGVDNVVVFFRGRW